MRKRLSVKHGKYGDDFTIVETTAGNFAIRRPTEEDLKLFDGLDELGEDKAGNQMIHNLFTKPFAVFEIDILAHK